MGQNLIDLKWDASHWAAADNALSALESAFSELVSFDPRARRRLVRMGKKSEAFCRQAVDMATEHAGILSRQFDLEGFQRDLAALDALRLRFLRVENMHRRMMDSELALGSDLMQGALESYALLKVAGKSSGLDGVKQSLSARFKRRTQSSSLPPNSEQPLN